MRLRSLWPKKHRPSKEHHGFPKREEGVDVIEVHVAGVCVRRTNEPWSVLVARRQLTRSLFPGKWECGGGQVRHGEGFSSALRRQFFEEFGLEVQVHYPLEHYEIHIPGKQRIIPGVRILCEANQGDVRLNTGEFSEYRWLDLPVTEQLDWIGGIKEILDRVANDLKTGGITRLQVDLETTTTSREVREGVSTCLRRYREGDFDGAMTAICGVVDHLTEQIHSSRSLSDLRKDSYQDRVSDAFTSLEAVYRASLVSLSSEEASRIWHNHRQAINQAAYVLGAFRREFSDAHGVQDADPRLVLRAVDCAVFIIRSLAGLHGG